MLKDFCAAHGQGCCFEMFDLRSLATILAGILSAPEMLSMIHFWIVRDFKIEQLKWAK